MKHSAQTTSLSPSSPIISVCHPSHPSGYKLNIIQEGKILPNPYLNEEKGKGIKVSEWLLENGVDAVCTTKAFDGKGPFFVLSSAEVHVIVTEAKTIEQIRQNLEKMGTLEATQESISTLNGPKGRVPRALPVGE